MFFIVFQNGVCEILFGLFVKLFIAGFVSVYHGGWYNVSLVVCYVTSKSPLFVVLAILPWTTPIKSQYYLGYKIYLGFVTNVSAIISYYF